MTQFVCLQLSTVILYVNTLNLFSKDICEPPWQNELEFSLINFA